MAAPALIIKLMDAIMEVPDRPEFKGLEPPDIYFALTALAHEFQREFELQAQHFIQISRRSNPRN